MENKFLVMILGFIVVLSIYGCAGSNRNSDSSEITESFCGKISYKDSDFQIDLCNGSGHFIFDQKNEGQFSDFVSILEARHNKTHILDFVRVDNITDCNSCISRNIPPLYNLQNTTAADDVMFCKMQFPIRFHWYYDEPHDEYGPNSPNWWFEDQQYIKHKDVVSGLQWGLIQIYDKKTGVRIEYEWNGEHCTKEETHFTPSWPSFIPSAPIFGEGNISFLSLKVPKAFFNNPSNYPAFYDQIWGRGYPVQMSRYNENARLTNKTIVNGFECHTASSYTTEAADVCINKEFCLVDYATNPSLKRIILSSDFTDDVFDPPTFCK